MAVLRDRLATLVQTKESIEAQVLDLTTEIMTLEEDAQSDKQRLAKAERLLLRRSMGPGAHDAPAPAELCELRSRVSAQQEKKTKLQETCNACIEQLEELSNVLDQTDEQHNDDNLLHFMLFSSA